MESYDRLVEKWAPVLNEEFAGTITDNHRKAVTAVVLENQEKEFASQAAQQNYLAEGTGELQTLLAEQQTGTQY